MRASHGFSEVFTRFECGSFGEMVCPFAFMTAPAWTCDAISLDSGGNLGRQFDETGHLLCGRFGGRSVYR